METKNDPALWSAIFGFFGIVITTLGVILTEQIRSRRKTEDVKQEVVNTKDSNESSLTELGRKVDALTSRLDDHIRYHLEGTAHVYLHRNPRRRDS